MRRVLPSVQQDIGGILIQVVAKRCKAEAGPVANAVVAIIGIAVRIHAKAHQVLVPPPVDHHAAVAIIGIVLQTPVWQCVNRIPPARAAHLPAVHGTAPVIIVTKVHQVPVPPPVEDLAVLVSTGIAARTPVRYRVDHIAPVSRVLLYPAVLGIALPITVIL